MTLMPAVLEPFFEFGLETYEQAKTFQANLVWQKLDEITLEEALSHWLSTGEFKQTEPKSHRILIKLLG